MISGKVNGTDIIPSMYLLITFLVIGVKTISSRHYVGNVASEL
jgi:hypothetical protein